MAMIGWPLSLNMVTLDYEEVMESVRDEVSEEDCDFVRDIMNRNGRGLNQWLFPASI
jgi:hypothetical protein